MNKDIENLVQNTDFNGYVIVDWDSTFGKTRCPNDAVAMCLERFRTAGSEELGQYVKAYRVFTMGAYHHTPGKRGSEEFDWRAALRELSR